MFEPIGGSAPKYTGQNVINPIAAISAVAMMLDTFGETRGRRGDRKGRDDRLRKAHQEPGSG